jgi:hypothetical protein
VIDPTRQAILESVKRVRDGVEPHRHAPFARHAMRIPERDFYALQKLYPGITARDPEVRQAAWDAFERSPFSEAYRVGSIVKGVIKNGDIRK